MDIRYFIGVDVSKSTLDWAVFDGNAILLQLQSPNSAAGIKQALRTVGNLAGFTPQASIVCLEHTGIYNALLLAELATAACPTWLESSLQIKQAGGLQRGKSDRVDAQRIAEYAFRFRYRTRLWEPPRQLLQDLASLSALRQRLLLVRSQLEQPINEQAGFVDPKRQKQLVKNCRASLDGINADLSSVNRQIEQLVEGDEGLNELFALVTSVTGIGLATATEIILATDEFKAISDPKKLACHAGVAPFEYRSGTSVRGKTRVSRHARKRLKSLLHMAAMSAIRSKGDLQDYYLRKVAQGKNRMLVLNAVRNKLVHRICAVVRRGEKYEKKHTPSLVL